MINLYDREAIRAIDPVNTYDTTEQIAEQCKVAWNEVTKLALPKYEGITNVVFCGMGASIYGALVLKALLGRNMPFPSEVICDYYLPEYVNDKTLVVLTSYSGSTEEVLSCANEAKDKGAKMVILTRGGKLAEFAKINSVPAYVFDGKLNSGNVPRLGCGYSILGLIGLLNKIGLVDTEEVEIANAITRLQEKFKDIKTQAMADVDKYINKIPIIFAAEHLSGNGQILRNQFNETSKTFSSYFLIPDLNHHLMEGLQFPADAPLKFIILNSPNYSDKVKMRVALTVEVVKQHTFEVHEYMTGGQTIYDDFLETLQYGSLLTLYLGLDYNQNPATNPWVDWFKAKLV